MWENSSTRYAQHNERFSAVRFISMGLLCCWFAFSLRSASANMVTSCITAMMIRLFVLILIFRFASHFSRRTSKCLFIKMFVCVSVVAFLAHWYSFQIYTYFRLLFNWISRICFSHFFRNLIKSFGTISSWHLFFSRRFHEIPRNANGGACLLSIVLYAYLIDSSSWALNYSANHLSFYFESYQTNVFRLRVISFFFFACFPNGWLITVLHWLCVNGEEKQ